MDYRGFTITVHPEWTEHGANIAFAARPNGLTIGKATGYGHDAAIEAGRRWIDAYLKTVYKQPVPLTG